MANSLQDQLKKSGLVDEKKAKQLSRAKRKENKLADKAKKGKVVDQHKLDLDAEKAARIARDKQLNQQKREKEQNRAIAAQIKQLIETHSIAKKAEQKYSFSDQGKIKQMWVEKAQVNHLSRGLIAITRLNQEYVLVPKQVADKIEERDATAIIFRAKIGDKSSSQVSSEEDPYANYQIPDDLDW